ncbi:MAG TPA: XrtA system polysaccharide chain length determinant [Gammaproteobacteria bacterium]|nr:XrtA system polysaccharide chain length determinant [Gammaproteobacteria bacterium]
MISIQEQVNEAFAYLHGLWRYRWSALLITWLVAIAGWMVVYALPNQYASKAVVHIDTTSIIKPLLQGLAVETNPAEELNVVTRILLSRDNLLAVLDSTGLGQGTEKSREDLVSSMRKAIRLNNISSRGSRSTIYEISYTSTSAEQSYDVVSSLLDTLIENTLNSGRTDTIKAEEFLDEQIRDYENRLAESEARLAEFKKKNVGFMPDEKGGYFARLRRAQDEIDSTKSSLRQARQRYSELRRQLSGESPMLGTSRYANATATKLRGYREQLADLLTQFTEEHPDVQAMRAKIANLQSSGLDASSAVASPEDDPLAEYNPVYQDLKIQESQARIEVSSLQITLAEKQQKLQELQQSVDIIPQVEADLARLDRDYTVTKDRYLTLVARRESARMAQKVEQSNRDVVFQVVEAPLVPAFPSGPNRELFLAGVMVLALGAGFGWCILMFLLYPTFVDFKQLQKMIDLPVLGAISMQVGLEQKRTRRLHLSTFLLALLLMFGVFGGVALYQQQGSEQLRLLLTGWGL